MGGAFPGQFPPALRIAALVQAALIVGMAAVVSLLINLITPSAGERAIWAPVALLLLISSAVVAIKWPSGRHAR